MTHPYVLTAVAALTSLRAAYPRLQETIEGEATGRHTRPRPRHLDERTAARQDDLLRQERTERRAGDTTFATSPAPIRAALLDAQISAEAVVSALCWDVAELLRLQPPPYVDAHRAYARYGTFDQRAAYLASGVRWVAPEHADRIARQLARADRQVRAALGIGPDLRPLPGGSICPACGEPSLRAEVSSPTETDWTIACTASCRCIGSQCSCRRPGREPGLPHIWPADEYASNFGQLRPYFDAMRAIEQGAITNAGLLYARADLLAQALGDHVTPRILRDWKRHGLITALKIGRTNWYRLDEAYTANEQTRDKTKPRVAA